MELIIPTFWDDVRVRDNVVQVPIRGAIRDELLSTQQIFIDTYYVPGLLIWTLGLL